MCVCWGRDGVGWGVTRRLGRWQAGAQAAATAGPRPERAAASKVTAAFLRGRRSSEGVQTARAHEEGSQLGPIQLKVGAMFLPGSPQFSIAPAEKSGMAWMGRGSERPRQARRQ